MCKTVTISQIRSASRNSAAEQQVLLGPPCAKCNACANCKELGAQIRGWCTFSRLHLTGEFCLRISIRWRSMVRCTFSRVRIFAGTAGRAASSPEIFRPFLTICLTVFPFEFRPWTFTIGFYGKKSFISELMILECSFPLNKYIYYHYYHDLAPYLVPMQTIILLVVYSVAKLVKNAIKMGAMQNYVMHCDVRSWRASGVMFDKTHCDRRSNNDWQESLLFLVDEYLAIVGFLLKDKGVVEHCLRSYPQTSLGGGTGEFFFEIVEQRRVD